MKKTKGISLIVLIITIVVIIVLATAIIVNLAQTNIIGNANEAVVKQDFKTMQDELTIYVADKYADTLGKFDVNNLNANKTTSPSVYEILTSLEKSKYKEYVIIENGKIAILETMPEPEKTWAMEALSLAGTSTNVPTEPETPEEPEYPQTPVGEKVTTNNATVTGKNPTYNNPVIPVGFKAVETTDASWYDSDNDGSPDGWNNGLVIQDEYNNEFVWVPVDGIDVTYTKNFSYPSSYGASSSNTSDDTNALPIGIDGTIIDENDQITTYGGFYIGRYEAGVPANQTTIDGTSDTTSDKTGKPVTKQYATVWTYISYTNANTNAKSFINTNNVKSGLLTGTQWDTTMKWIENSGINVSTDSTSWGNYKVSTAPANVAGYGKKQTAGYSEYWKAKNIYDLAGNTYEWTGETLDSSDPIGRGGDFLCSGSYNPASCRLDGNPYYTSSNMSFRLVLYVM